MPFTTELMQRALEREKIIRSANYREKDKPVRQCPKCKSPLFFSAQVDASDGIFTDPKTEIYCPACRIFYDTDDVKMDGLTGA